MNFATAKFIGMQEATAPLPAEEDQQITRHFKACYVQQVRCWVLCQKKNGKKKLLFDFLQGKSCNKTRTRSSSSMNHSPAPSELILHSGNCTINLNSAFNARPTTRQINRNRFSSPGTNLVFNETPPEPIIKSRTRSSLSSSNCSRLSQFLVDKLLQPSSASQHLNLADEYMELLQELSMWVEKKANNFPVDPIRDHPHLSPVAISKMNASKDREDHLERQSMLSIEKMKARNIVTQHKWRTPPSQYSNFFDDEEHQRTPSRLNPFPPFEKSRPFCQFPDAIKKESTPVDDAFNNQAKTNTMIGHGYKNIFQSATCL